MWVLVGPESRGTEKVAQAAIVVPKREKDDVIAWLGAQIRDVGPLGGVMHLNGRHSTFTSYDEVAEKALTEDEGLRLASDFFYIDPWFQGREAALAPSTADHTSTVQMFNMIALFLVAFAGIKFLVRRTRRSDPVI